MKTFSFDSNRATRADSTAGGIRKTGAYTLTIFQCAWRQSRDTTSKAEMLDFVLGDPDSGSKVLSRLVITKKDGSESFGMGYFQAMLGLLGIKDATVEAASVFSLNNQSQPGFRIKAVERKQLGFVLQYVEEKDSDGYQVLNDRGYPKYHMEIRCVFDPATNQTYSEKKAGSNPSKVAYWLGKLTDDHAKVRTSPDAFESPAHTAPASSNTSMDDPIPF